MYTPCDMQQCRAAAVRPWLQYHLPRCLQLWWALVYASLAGRAFQCWSGIGDVHVMFVDLLDQKVWITSEHAQNDMDVGVKFP